jgi:hypothetical protein
MRTLKSKDFLAYGLSGTVPSCRILAQADFTPTAQHAISEARVVAHNVAAELRGGQKQPFRYTSLGQLVAIAGAPEWLISWASIPRGSLPGGSGAQSI